MKKCNYCGKEISYHEFYCSDECQSKANAYYEKSEKYRGFFSVVNIICIFAIPMGIFVYPFVGYLAGVAVTAAIILLGVMLLVFPFPTENMITKHKIEKAVKHCRYIACGVIIFGLLVAAFTLIYFRWW